MNINENREIDDAQERAEKDEERVGQDSDRTKLGRRLQECWRVGCSIHLLPKAFTQTLGTRPWAELDRAQHEAFCDAAKEFVQASKEEKPEALAERELGKLTSYLEKNKKFFGPYSGSLVDFVSTLLEGTRQAVLLDAAVMMEKGYMREQDNMSSATVRAISEELDKIALALRNASRR